MNRFSPRAYGIVLALSFAVVLLSLPGCGSRQKTATLDQLESILSVSIPRDAQLVGGRESTEGAKNSVLWLIKSAEPLPLPSTDETNVSHRSTSSDRPAGTPFPVSALSNLMSACQVSSNDGLLFTGESGRMHNGRYREWQFAYREAPTDRGWLTAVEVFSDQEFK